VFVITNFTKPTKIATKNLVMLTDKTFLVCAITFAAACSGCGAGSGGSAQAQTVTVAQGIEQLVKSGAMPQLDTSSSLLGTDADGNGVRDDIDAYIASLPVTDAQKRALTQSAAVINATLTVDLTNKAALNELGHSMLKSTFCVGSQSNASLLDKYDSNIEKYTINTKIRFAAYQAYNKARGGSSSGLTAQDMNALCD
jgi:hypothetical protein